MCSIDDPAESGGVILLWSIIWDRYACNENNMRKIQLLYSDSTAARLSYRPDVQMTEILCYEAQSGKMGKEPLGKR